MHKINELDTRLFLYLNGKHNAFFDPVMYWTSHKLFWIPFYALLVYIIIKEYKRNSLHIFVAIAILITLCDQISSHLIKQCVKRLRPSHDPALEGLVHLSAAGPGGKYGFVSSYAANAFGLAVFLILLLPKRYNVLKWVLLFWACLVSYSRIYVGVHYPADVVAAGVLGAMLAYLVFLVYRYVMQAYFQRTD